MAKQQPVKDVMDITKKKYWVAGGIVGVILIIIFALFALPGLKVILALMTLYVIPGYAIFMYLEYLSSLRERETSLRNIPQGIPNTSRTTRARLWLTRQLPIIPPLYEGWFLTKSSLEHEEKLIFSFFICLGLIPWFIYNINRFIWPSLIGSAVLILIVSCGAIIFLRKWRI